MLRSDEAGLYRGGINGFRLDNVAYDGGAGQVTVDYSVTRAGTKMDLTGPEGTNGGSLRIKLAWTAAEYSNEGSAETPAQPTNFDGLDVGNTVTDLGGGNYRTVIDVPSAAFGILNVSMEGHPQADLLGDGVYSRIPVKDVFSDVDLDPRGEGGTRRNIVGIAKCNACHDNGGAGLTLHGTNRTSNINHCASCHNPDATDINQRPADPMDAVDGKKEETIDFKRMIHQIHAGEDLQNGIVLYGFFGSINDFSNVSFIGNNQNCLTCHEDGTYSTDQAWHTLPSTIDTGADVATPADDLNISQTSAVCSSCHDDDLAKHHMLLNGASFMALDDDIAHPGLPDPIPVPEPGAIGWVAGFGWLGLLHRLRRRKLHRGVCSTPR
jgi:OmcA/MtrC family decaheme c-type cytochrome